MTKERIKDLIAEAGEAGRATISVGRHSPYCSTGATVLVAPTETDTAWTIVWRGGNTGERRDRDETVAAGSLDDIRAALAQL